MIGSGNSWNRKGPVCAKVVALQWDTEPVVTNLKASEVHHWYGEVLLAAERTFEPW
jgi:hypothetical protein